jgi:hypothetical protein
VASFKSYFDGNIVSINMAAILFSSDDDVYCDSCDAKLYVRKDNSMVCSNPQCGRVYNEGSITKHRSKLKPAKDLDAPMLIPLTEYHNYDGKRKKKEVTKYEDDYFVSRKSGLSITDSEEFLPAGDR